MATSKTPKQTTATPQPHKSKGRKKSSTESTTEKKKKSTTEVLHKKKNKSAIGAPSQHSQPSRKGKKAWRKNVDIEDVEQVMEEIRTEERVTGQPLHTLKDGQLFHIDIKGDEKIRKKLPKHQLTSTKIIAQRSAVPAVFSRHSTSSKKRKSPIVLTKEEKTRLLRIAKRPRKGPFSSVLDPAEYLSGSGVVDLSQAVKDSGTYDPWSARVEIDFEALKEGMETVIKRAIKPPKTKKTRDAIEVPAILQPHQGSSYNPPVDAHQELLLEAAEKEEKRLKEADKFSEVKKKMEAARKFKNDEEEEGDLAVVRGMKVQEIVDDVDEDEEEEEGEEKKGTTTKAAQRKTKAQKNRAKKLREEKRALSEKAHKKKLLSAVNGAKALRRQATKLTSAKEEEREQKRLAELDMLKKQGLAGKKLGKHKVPDGRVEVQLGEDLSESFRGLKPEGNLFSDRFQSLQQRALVEPRVPVIPKKRTTKVIEYEKHAWKKFE